MIAVFSEQEWDFMSISASAAGIDGAEENSEDEHDIRMVVGRERDGRRRRNAVCVRRERIPCTTVPRLDL